MMYYKQLIILLALLSIMLAGSKLSVAEEASPVCNMLEDKASGDLLKYSLDGDVNGPVFFSGISCAVKYRNKELCAMEMISFDTTSKVYDYYTQDKIEAAKAFFWFDKQDSAAPILAFSTKQGAEKYAAEKKSGLVLGYTGLTEKILIK